MLSREHSQRRRRILMITHGYPPNQVNGGEMQAHRKARWWNEHGHDVLVVAADPTLPGDLSFDEIVEEAEELFEGVPVHRVRLASPDATRPVQETYQHPGLVPVLERHIAQFQPDMIYQVSGYIFGTIPLDLAAAAGIPAFLFVLDFWHTCQRITMLRPDGTCCTGPRGPADCAACRLTDHQRVHHLGPTMNRALWHATAHLGDTIPVWPDVSAFSNRRTDIVRALNSTTLIISNSQFLAGWMRKLGVPAERLLVSRQGIDRAEFENQVMSPRPVKSGLRALYLGQLSRHKGVDLLISAVHDLQNSEYDLTLRAYGPMTDNHTFLDRVTPMVDGNRIQLSPPVPRSMLGQTLAESDFLVVPSRWYDISPNVILEALAAGVPVIGSGHGGIADMIRHNVDGLLIEPGSVESLMNAIKRLFAEPGLLEKLRAGIQPPFGVDDEMRVEEAAIETALHTAGSTSDVYAPAPPG